MSLFLFLDGFPGGPGRPGNDGRPGGPGGPGTWQLPSFLPNFMHFPVIFLNIRSSNWQKFLYLTKGTVSVQ